MCTLEDTSSEGESVEWPRHVTSPHPDQSDTIDSPETEQREEWKDQYGSLSITGDSIVFSPPLYRQRYENVKKMITSVGRGTFTKIVDLGCSDMKFFRYLLDIPELQEIVMLDKDQQVLQDSEHRTNPLAADYLFLRQTMLHVSVVCGDATIPHPILTHTHVVTLIEVVEHLQLSDLPALVKCMFDYVRPALVVITTPNADFNKYIPGFTPGTFRHWDHKFEWTAAEFQEWCEGIVKKYSNYSLEISGCGLGPNNTYCTQVGMFTCSRPQNEHTPHTSLEDLHTFSQDDPLPCLLHLNIADDSSDMSDSYKIVSEYDYPYDKRTQEEKDKDNIYSRFYPLRRCLLEGVQDTDIDPPRTLLPPLPSQAAHHTEDELATFSLVYLKCEDSLDVGNDTENKYIFYIIDNRYAVLPMKSLIAWVNYGAERKLTTDLVRVTVGEECSETAGSGNDWKGYLLLYEDTFSDEAPEDSIENDDSEDEGGGGDGVGKEWWSEDQGCDWEAKPDTEAAPTWTQHTEENWDEVNPNTPLDTNWTLP